MEVKRAQMGADVQLEGAPFAWGRLVARSLPAIQQQLTPPSSGLGSV